MSRLTEKVKNTDDYIKLPTKDKQEFINKLGKLEDLEEQLGCPLNVVFKALANGIYVENVPKEELIIQFYLRLTNLGNEWYLSNNTMCVNLKDYKTLFWLRGDKSE